ncbi:cyclin-dependent kinase inhibitor 1B [Lucilia sericata]|uniref:cyclin-dependent kinase inhibitor 1B n=1 Tax=Lucilia sericata TaxID=13632 RepID=UPI0018A81C4B|nr:cyclin-dependent kinase inhibitor 1B [Lucilia sericata]
MSAARVLNPMLNEFCKMTSSPHALRTNLSCGRQLNRIKRDLFGPANPIETNKIFNEELEKHQEKAAKKWGFDFRNGSPLSANSQYIWERVSSQESCIAPEMYTLTRAAHVRPVPATPAPKTHMEMLMDERADRENFNISQSSATDTDSCDDSQDESMVVFKVPAGPHHAEATLAVPRKTQLRKRQPKITEYMKERKRLAQTPKKVSPAKRMRTSSGSSSSSASHFNHAVNANSIAAHFSVRTQRHN